MTIQRNGRETVESLARSLKLAPATIRRHMDILQRDHLISFQEVKRPTGRPEYSFFLTEDGHEALPKSYGRLLDSLFQEMTSLETKDIEGKDGKGLTEVLLSRIAQRIADQAGLSPDDDLSKRAATLTSLLEEQQFTPRVEHKNGTVRIELLNCPFRSVALEHECICAFDSHLISTILGTPVSLEKCVAWGDTTCLYMTPNLKNRPKDVAATS
jgi:predicted ArsR family transcriptional regulator